LARINSNPSEKTKRIDRENPETMLVEGEHTEQLCKVSIPDRKLQGTLYLSNYKLLFKPTTVLLKDCLRFTMPFGEIAKVQEHSDKEFTLWLKDERSFKFS
jgi:hypothetical protein